MESKRRSLIKGITYRIMATIATATVAYIFTKDINSSLQIGFMDFFVKLSLYFINDRIWNKINWGIKTQSQTV